MSIAVVLVAIVVTLLLAGLAVVAAVRDRSWWAAACGALVFVDRW